MLNRPRTLPALATGLGLALALGLCAATRAADLPAPTATTAAQVEDAKGAVLRLQRDLLVLEEEMLYPPSTQVAVFVSIESLKMFELDSLQLLLDGKVVASQLYGEREWKALQRGGVQKVYVGNLPAGAHTLVAFFSGKGTHERDHKRGVTVKFDKASIPKLIELQVRDSTAQTEAEFGAKVWQ